MNWAESLKASVIRARWYEGEIDDLELIRLLANLNSEELLKVPCKIDVKLYYEALIKRSLGLS
jgi:hypothetical protein